MIVDFNEYTHVNTTLTQLTSNTNGYSQCSNVLKN